LNLQLLKMKKLYIPFNKYEYLGGPATFMNNLRHYLKKSKYLFTENINQADSIFFPISYNLNTLDYFRDNNLPIIQRLDGIYYPSQHGSDYININLPIKKIYLEYASYIVFQSNYSKSQCFAMFGNIPENKYSIIPNGVNKKIYYPSDSNNLNKNIQFVCTGIFRKPAMLEPIIKALDKLKDKYSFTLNVVGVITDNTLTHYLNRSYIKCHGKKKPKEIADIFRSSDIYLHTQINDNCPNAVIEAISCGLPVVGFDSGAMSELCFFSKDLLAYVSDNIFQEYKDFDYNKLADKIELSVANISYYKNKLS